VLGEGQDHVMPVLPVPWERYISLIGKDAICAAGKRFRHETQLDKWPDSVVEHEIVDLIDVEEVEVPGAGSSDSHFIVEQAMAADRRDAGLFVNPNQVLPPLLAQSHHRAI
jgi:hypothetical protein